MTTHDAPAWSMQRRCLNVFAVVTMAATFGLLFAGGLVTSNKVGMAVPDWPGTFQQNPILYWFFDKDVGIQIEHSHRLIAGAIGLLTIVLGVMIGCIERRMWVLGLGAIAILLVIAQAILGGMRVLFNDSTIFQQSGGVLLAAIHGCTAQVFFALTIVLAAVTSRWWVEAVPILHDDARRVQRFTLGLAVVIYLQIVFGASVRHFGSGPMFFFHFGLAALLLLGVIWIGLMILTEPSLRNRLGTPTVVLLFAIGVQIMLGLASMSLTELLPPNMRKTITTPEAITTTTHLIFGSVVFGTCVYLAIRSRRLLTSARIERSPMEPQRVLESVA